MKHRKAPFFSVIVPVYNVREYLVECVDSVLRQSYTDYEIILIDDGSDDGSETICEQYGNEYDNVRVVHKKNGGQSSARNLGVKLSRGQYFIFVDSDDYIANNSLELFKHSINRHSDLDVILSERMYNVEPDGTVLDRQRRLDISNFDGISGKEALIKMGMGWSPCGKCYRTDYWRGKGFCFTEGIISEDFLLIDRVVLEAKKIAMITPHYFYRWKNISSTMHANYGKLTSDTMFVIEDWEKYIRDNALGEEINRIIRVTLANMFEHTVMGNIFFSEKNIDDLIDRADSCKYVLKYDTTMEGYIIRALVRVVGMRHSCGILNKLKILKKRINRFV